MRFIASRLATRLEDPRPLADPRFIAELKLDGTRARVPVREHRTAHVFGRTGRSLSRSAAIAVLLVLLTGCASSPPTPVTSIGPLVGNWAGTVAAEKGTQQFLYLTINADQTLVATWGINWSWGRVTLANGQATYQMTPPPFEGTLRFYRGNGTPTLYMDDLWANFRAVLTKQQ